MSRLSPDAWLGAAIIALGAFLLLVLIPFGVTSPSNVRIAVLSPTMWPKIVSAALILLGGILFLRAFLAGPGRRAMLKTRLTMAGIPGYGSAPSPYS